MVAKSICLAPQNETIGEAITLVGIYVGESSFKGFVGGAGIRPSTVGNETWAHEPEDSLKGRRTGDGLSRGHSISHSLLSTRKFEEPLKSGTFVSPNDVHQKFPTMVSAVSESWVARVARRGGLRPMESRVKSYQRGHPGGGKLGWGPLATFCE